VKLIDYVVCFIISDFAAATLLAGSWMFFLVMFCYVVYEDFRKWQIHGK
jgi:hypothetical protein